MKSYSPIKKRLLDLQNTPAKVIVENQINGWMETCAKEKNKRTHRLLRPKIKISNKCESFASIQYPQHYDISNLEQLKEKKLNLIKCSVQKLSQKLKNLPDTAESIEMSNNLRSKRGTQVKIRSTIRTRKDSKAKIIEVSQFPQLKEQDQMESQQIFLRVNINSSFQPTQIPKPIRMKIQDIRARHRKRRQYNSLPFQTLQSERGTIVKQQGLSFITRRLVSAKTTINNQ